MIAKPLLALCLMMTLAFSTLAQTSSPTTFSYKQISGHQILLDVYPADEPAPRPTVFYIHSGALIMGGRTGIPNGVPEYFTQKGAHFISAHGQSIWGSRRAACTA